ncbi:MAG: hypothetical protein PHF86_09695 [Candidatus Nanoarchaeia archaeon]|jgi:uncharacterized membrane protein YheB (UPF0754 family)|nr:hypothetical protein [Candidatus Nanoarchaeia archaeon]
MEEKFYTQEEITEEIKKALYKCMLKKFKDIKTTQKELTNKIVEDIEDKNNIAEIDPDKIPNGQKTNVLWKKKKTNVEGNNPLNLRKKNTSNMTGFKRLKDFLNRKKVK